MASPPKIPREQSSFADRDAPRAEHAAVPDDRGRPADAVARRPGDADVNPDQQVRFGNLKQTLTTHWKVQQR